MNTLHFCKRLYSSRYCSYVTAIGLDVEAIYFVILYTVTTSVSELNQAIQNSSTIKMEGKEIIGKIFFLAMTVNFY